MHSSLVLSVVQFTCEYGHISVSKVALPCHGKQVEHKPVRGRLDKPQWVKPLDSPENEAPVE